MMLFKCSWQSPFPEIVQRNTFFKVTCNDRDGGIDHHIYSVPEAHYFVNGTTEV